MALHMPAGTDLNFIDAINESHRALVALEASKPHYDGAERTADRVLQVLSTYFPSAPTTLAAAVDVVEKGIVLFDSHHVTRGNSGTGLKIYAHKTAGAPIGGTPSSAGAVLEQAMVDAWGPVALAIATWLQGHMLNTGGAYHSTPDSFNALGTLPSSIATKAELSRILNLTRATKEDHLPFTAGGVHGAADSTNVTSAAPVDNQDDWDGMLALMVELITDLAAHGANTGGSYHANADARALPASPSFPAAVTAAFGRANTLKSTLVAHMADTGLHESADAGNSPTASNATTVATLITLATELRTKEEAHFLNAPVSAAVR